MGRGAHRLGRPSGLYADTTDGKKRLKYSDNFRLYPTTEYDSAVVQVQKFEVSLSSQRRNDREAQARSELFDYSVDTDIAIADITKGGRDFSPAAMGRVAELQKDYNELEENIRTSIDDGNYESESLKDMVFMDLILVSPRKIKNAYYVVTLRYHVPDRDFPEGKRLLTTGRVHRVGDLSADKSTRVKLRFRVPEGILSEARYRLYLMDGASQDVATSMSHGLRELSANERSESDK